MMPDVLLVKGRVLPLNGLIFICRRMCEIHCIYNFNCCYVGHKIFEICVSTICNAYYFFTKIKIMEEIAIAIGKVKLIFNRHV